MFKEPIDVKSVHFENTKIEGPEKYIYYLRINYFINILKFWSCPQDSDLV